AARIVVAQRREDERIERDKARQVKDQPKQMARREKESRKTQQILEKEQEMINMVDNDTGIADETRIISNSLDSIAYNPPLFQDLINIQVPHYQIEGLPTCLFLLEEVSILCMLITHLHLMKGSVVQM
ncbi:hypothetical protein, partial [Acinetobacter oleivorans]|uniref:hypothetical protein n=1 Tax=Acinetobacter oleivorans TaxID=1148157 RepID=UPI00148F0806